MEAQRVIYAFAEIRPDPIPANHADIAKLEESECQKTLRQAVEDFQKLQELGDLPGQSRERWRAESALHEARTEARETTRSRRLSEKSEGTQEAEKHALEAALHRWKCAEATGRVENALIRTRLNLASSAE